MSNYSLIRQAILDRRQIVATYRGHVRELCPHVIGTKQGQAHALLFQFAGSSSNGLPPGGDWRCMPVDGLANLEVRDGRWFTGDNYDAQKQTCIDEIDVELSP